DARVVGAGGSARGEEHLAAQLRVLLEERDAMTTERRHAGRLQPRDPAADYDDLLRDARLADVAQLTLASGGGVLNAGDRLALINAVDAPLVRPHARPNVVEPPLARPPPKVAVRDEGARHAHRSEEHTSELQSRFDLVCRLLLEKKNNNNT